MTIPLPLTFELPDGWQPVDPLRVGQPANTFVAVHPASATDFTANIMITEHDRPDPATLTELADESVRRLDTVAKDVTVVHREEIGSPAAPGVNQILRMSADTHPLVQCQTLLAFTDAEDPHHRIIVELALTATETQLEQVAEDFEQFIASVRLDRPAQ